MFQNVISQLVREGKTVVLVTNQLQFVNHADKIVFLKHDKVAQEAWVHKQGSYSELMQNQDFAELMKDVGAGDDEAIERSPKAAQHPQMIKETSCGRCQREKVTKGRHKQARWCSDNH